MRKNKINMRSLVGTSDILINNKSKQKFNIKKKEVDICIDSYDKKVKGSYRNERLCSSINTFKKSY